MTEIQQILFSHQDKKYADFVSKLVPTVPKERFIGVRSPEFKKIIRDIKSNLSESQINDFLQSLPHEYHEENILQVCLLNNLDDYDEYIEKISVWIQDDKPYTKRVAMLFLKKYYLHESFSEEYLQWAAKIRTDEYYVNMMTAWLFADSLVYQWDTTIKFLQEQKLDIWTHNKTIQKARESFRITPEQKDYLKTLKRKSK